MSRLSSENGISSNPWRETPRRRNTLFLQHSSIKFSLPAKYALGAVWPVARKWAFDLQFTYAEKTAAVIGGPTANLQSLFALIVIATRPVVGRMQGGRRMIP